MPAARPRPAAFDVVDEFYTTRCVHSPHRLSHRLSHRLAAFDAGGGSTGLAANSRIHSRIGSPRSTPRWVLQTRCVTSPRQLPHPLLYRLAAFDAVGVLPDSPRQLAHPLLHRLAASTPRWVLQTRCVTSPRQLAHPLSHRLAASTPRWLLQTRCVPSPQQLAHPLSHRLAAFDAVGGSTGLAATTRAFTLASARRLRRRRRFYRTCRDNSRIH
jgi:hypothetical protein